MKKLPLLGIFLLFVATLAYAAVTTTGDPISGNPGETVQGSFTLENNEADLVNVSFSASPIFGGDNINVLTSVTNINIAAGETRPINYEVSIPEAQSAGNYTGSIIIFAENESGAEFVAGTYNFTITVNELTKVEVSAPSSVEIEPKETKTIEVTLRNTGNQEVTDLAFSYDSTEFEDDDSNEIILTFSDSGFSLLPGDEKTITLELEAEEEVFLDDYTGTIELKSGTETISSFELNIDVYTSLFHAIDLDVSSDDELAPGDTLDFDIELRDADFDMEDVKIKVWVLDIDDGDDLDAETDRFDIDHGDDETEGFSFDIPLNVDKGYYDIKVKITGEDADDSTNDFTLYKVFRQPFEVVKDSDDEVDFEYLNFMPETPQCGGTLTITTKAVNTGDRDQDDMYLKLVISELGIEQTSEIFDLDNNRYDDREKIIDFVITLPEDMAESEYLLKVYAYDKHDGAIGVISERFTPTGDCGVDSTTGTDNDQTTGTDDEDDDNVQYLPTGSAISDFFNKESVQLTFWTLGVIALIVIIVYFITLIFKQK